MIEQKKNDWLATMFFSPDKTIQDLFNIGINTDNSSLQDKDYYKNIPQIKEAFKTDNGNFDSAKFDKYYQEVQEMYNYADNQKFENTVADSYSYDIKDIFAPLGSNIRNNSPRIVSFQNTFRKSRGLSNIHEISAQTMSAREVAEANKVYDFEKKKFLDWSPNDKGGVFDALTRPTLVLATWDEDGYEDIDGRKVFHKKGEYKYNEYGDTYYETLGGRDSAGKDVLSWTDTLTVDGSDWNKYDFFDSDDLDKSATGTIMKAVIKTVPLFIPYFNIGKVYAAAGAIAELGKLIPTLYKSIEGIATGDLSNSKSSETANSISTWFKRFDNSLSDHGRESFFRFEQLADIASSSFSQLKQQRLIGELPKMYADKFKNGEITENMVKLGRNFSYAYMAGTSSTHAYDDFKNAGASDRVAGLGMFAVTGAMFKLMDSDYFRDFWYKGTYLDNAKYRTALRHASQQASKKIFTKEAIQEAEKETLKGAKAAAN